MREVVGLCLSLCLLGCGRLPFSLDPDLIRWPFADAAEQPPDLPPPEALVVVLSGRTPEVSGLRVAMTIGGRQVPAPDEIWGPDQRLLLRLPQGAAGKLAVRVDGVLESGCAVSRGSGEAELPAVSRSVRVALQGLPGGRALCPFSVAMPSDSAGVVTSEPAGIDCGARCATEFPVGTLVVLAQVPGDGASFGGWFGACQGETCSLLLDRAAQVVVDFPAGRAATSLKGSP